MEVALSAVSPKSGHTGLVLAGGGGGLLSRFLALWRRFSLLRGVLLRRLHLGVTLGFRIDLFGVIDVLTVLLIALQNRGLLTTLGAGVTRF